MLAIKEMDIWYWVQSKKSPYIHRKQFQSNAETRFKTAQKKKMAV